MSNRKFVTTKANQEAAARVRESAARKVEELGDGGDRDLTGWFAAARTAVADVERLTAERDSLETRIHEDGGFISRMVDAEAEVERLRHEAQQHALANGGCVPWPAYQDLSDAHHRLMQQLVRVEALLEPHRTHDAISGKPNRPIDRVHIRARDLRSALDGSADAIQARTGTYAEEGAP